jgi:magnesium transporter
MVRIFFHANNSIEKTDNIELLKSIPKEKLLWVDLQFPSNGEKRIVETAFSIDFNELKLENEVESNTRFFETEDWLLISSNFITKKENFFENTPCFFYIHNDVLITERDADMKSFAEIVKKIKRTPKAFKKGGEILEGILETKVDLDADFIEQLAKDIALTSRNLSLKADANKEDILLKISEYQEATTLSRESFIEKQRIVSALLKCNTLENKERLKILIKDINAMLEYTSFIFMRLEYLQNTVLGLINIEQNKAIKIFTIVAVVFMPPTLIASMYGMNFKSMPELNWSFGYPLAILLIVGSSLFTLLIFKRKKWL